MTDTVAFRTLIQNLRAASPSEQARQLYFYSSVLGDNVTQITKTLLDSIAEGSLPPSVIQRWLGVSRKPQAVAQTFFQSKSVYARGIAIRFIAKMMRNDHIFKAIWGALGGAKCLGQHMAKLSIDQHRSFCTALGALGRAGSEKSRAHRQNLITSLYDFFMDPGKNTEEGRPVKGIYVRLIPACTFERAVAYLKTLPDEGNDMHTKERRNIQLAHWGDLEERALKTARYWDSTYFDLEKLKVFISRSLDFALRVLELIVTQEDIHIPNGHRFLCDLALPLAYRLASKCRSTPIHNHVWVLLHVAFEKNLKLKEKLADTPSNPEYQDPRNPLVQYAAKSWSYCRGADKSSENLAKLFRFLPASFLTQERRRALLELVAPGLRYEFLRVWLANSAAHQIDIGANDLNGSTTPLKGIKLDVELFIILGATDDPGPDSELDTHILRALLNQRAGSKNIGLFKDAKITELDRRKELAKKTRKSWMCAFWVVSSLHLCAALRDFSLLKDTLLWARRFNRDPLAVKGIYPRLDITPMLACGVMSPGRPRDRDSR